MIWRNFTSCLQDLEEDLEALKPKPKSSKKRDGNDQKRPLKRPKISELIDDEALEVDEDDDDEDSEGKFINKSFKIVFYSLNLFIFAILLNFL